MAKNEKKKITISIPSPADLSTIIVNFLMIWDRYKTIVTASVAGVTGLGIWRFLEATTEMGKILVVALALFATIVILCWYYCFKMRKQVIEKDAELTEKNAALEHAEAELAEKSSALAHKDMELINRNTELEERDAKLKEKNKKLRELSEKVAVLVKVLHSKIPQEIGFYVANKEKYDSFKTDLHLQKCLLEVSIPQKGGPVKQHGFCFKWILDLKNYSQEPIEEAKFIYSGEKNLYPKVFIQQGDESGSVNPAMERDEKFTGEDCFITIPLLKPLEYEDSATVTVEYTSYKYPFGKPCDTIWLAPDALGFANVSKFCIRVFHDGEIISDKTDCVLRTYQFSGQYSEENDKGIESSKKDKDIIFECIEGGKGKRRLHGHAYLMVLIHDWKNLPPYLRDMHGPS